MADPGQPSESLIRQWLLAKHDVASVQTELSGMLIPAELADEYLRLYKKRLIEKYQLKGFVLLASGAFLGFASCVLSILNPIPGLYYFILFGLTSVAVILICIGLYYLLER